MSSPVPAAGDRWRFGLGLAFLAVQLGLLVRSHFMQERYFCWAPHTVQVEFRLDVELGGRHLDAFEAQQRYRLHDPGWEAHAAANLIDVIRRYERSYGRADNAHVFVRYRSNGGAWQTYRWPER